jgi:hypothetical protein
MGSLLYWLELLTLLILATSRFCGCKIDVGEVVSYNPESSSDRYRYLIKVSDFGNLGFVHLPADQGGESTLGPSWTRVHSLASNARAA